MTNPWTLTESQCAFKRRLATDALFTLGNGYLGCRGFFEEEQEGVESLGGIYMAGVFGEGALKAWKGMHRELVNTPNFLWLSIKINGEPVLVRPRRISGYKRALDMRNGIMTRSFVWRSAKGARVRLDFERFISAANLHVAGQRLRITPLDGPARIEVAAGIDATVKQHNMLTTLPLPIQPGRKHLEPRFSRGGMIEAKVATLPGGVKIAEGQQVRMLGPNGLIPGEPMEIEGRVAERFVFTCRRNVAAQMTKLIHFYTSRDGNAMALLRKSMRKKADYDSLLQDRKRHV